ncbi:VIT1/CCC1 transporter family protein [Patescibacteria group bacterium]|nr:VIT1/CCC1 transporter family protein [Patescibacteria group bacterium]
MTDTSYSKRTSLYLRNIIFGAEDSLVSTVGLLAGIAIGKSSATQILLTGVVYLFVGGFSMAAGSYLSEHSAQEYETGTHVKDNGPLFGAIAMFFSFILSGFGLILPYLFFPIASGIFTSIVLSIILLAILGYAQGKISKVSPLRSTIRMVVIGGIAIILGVVIGKFLGIA